MMITVIRNQLYNITEWYSNKKKTKKPVGMQNINIRGGKAHEYKVILAYLEFFRWTLQKRRLFFFFFKGVT